MILEVLILLGLQTRFADLFILGKIGETTALKPYSRP